MRRESDKTVVYPTHSYKSWEEKLQVDEEWAIRHYTCNWDWDKPVSTHRCANALRDCSLIPTAGR